MNPRLSGRSAAPQRPRERIDAARQRAAPLLAAADQMTRARITFVADALGGRTALARLLRVNRGQVARWLSGEERPSGKAGSAISDLDYVVGRALAVWAPASARVWLTSQNSYLDGARPIDVLHDRGSTEVVEALDHAAAGGFA